ncbi:hypothetical protein OHT52_30125 [Streptomyces sp. NBC_00247]|nr:hypothetical protein [Streptomyces sp. NBC_00247]
MRATAPAPAFVGLFSTGEGAALCTDEGFTPGDMTGMFRLVDPAS